MKKTVIIYGSTTGNAAKAAETIAAKLLAMPHQHDPLTISRFLRTKTATSISTAWVRSAIFRDLILALHVSKKALPTLTKLTISTFKKLV